MRLPLNVYQQNRTAHVFSVILAGSSLQLEPLVLIQCSQNAIGKDSKVLELRFLLLIEPMVLLNAKYLVQVANLNPRHRKVQNRIGLLYNL
jgi:hypothetical protein